MRKAGILIRAAGTVLGLLFIASVWLNSSFSGFSGDWPSNLIETISSIGDPPPAPTPDLDIVIRGLHQEFDLITAELETDTTVTYYQQNDKCGLVQLGDTKVVFHGRGLVRAGIDFDEVKDDNIRLSGETLIIELPPPFIIDPGLDPSRSGVLFEDEADSLFCDSPATSQTLTEIYRIAEKELLNNACEARLLEEANANAEDSLRQLIEKFGFSEVIIETTTPKQCS